MNELDELRELLPFLIHLALIQFALLLAALLDLLRRPKTRGPKWLWIILILFVQMIGPIAYFVIGREEG
ncbi:MAG: hypothetical protein Fur0021_14100 [Candidatus Promineifilaceae bacterium]